MTTALKAVAGPAWTWGDRIRKVRREIARVSQGNMAQMIGVNTATLSSWEGNRATPHRLVAEPLAQQIEEMFPGRVTAAWLLGQEDNGPHPGRTADGNREPNYLDLIENLLPRMDSNHQPPGGSITPGQTAILRSVSTSYPTRQTYSRQSNLRVQPFRSQLVVQDLATGRVAR
jgi:DNA-binding XRE family transcriptional regulator